MINHTLAKPTADTTPTVPVWDILVRVFHWSLVFFFFTAYLTGDEHSWIHQNAGYAVLGLVLFRIVWGVIGTRYARFSSFLFRPREVVAYLKSLLTLHPRRYLGHNPAGAVMILALLFSLVMTAWSGIQTQEAEAAEHQASSGVFINTAVADDDYGHGGEHDGDEVWEEVHEFFANFTLLLVFGHVAGVAVSSLLHRENLVRAMVTGRKPADDATP